MKKSVCMLVLLVAVSNASATYDWYGPGKTSYPAGVSQDWFNPANWNSGVPVISALNPTGVRTYGGAAYNTSLATAVIIANGDARAFNVRVGSGNPSDETAARLIINSGTLKTTTYLMIGTDSATNGGRSGIVYMHGGTVTLGGATADGLDNGSRNSGHLFVGFGIGSLSPSGKLIMDGGLIDAGGDFDIGQNNTRGSAYLSGNAVIKANQLIMRSTTLATNTAASAYLSITGSAKVIINGDITANVALWKSYGWINPEVLTSLTINPDQTTTTLFVPTLFVPEPATICILILGALISFRHK